MHLSKVNEALNHRISGGSEYHWNCYGINVRFLDYESNYAHVSVVFDTTTQEVYEVTIESKDESIRPYRYLNPSTKDSFLSECKEKGVDPYTAWENIKYCDTEIEEDFLGKAEAIFKGESFDTRVQIPIDLDDSELFQLMKIAHERDITFNKLVEEILWNVINTEKNKIKAD